MPQLPSGNYEHIVIHDNFQALRRYADHKGKADVAEQGLMIFNGRFITFEIDGVCFVASGMGSAQTTCLLESLKAEKCRVVIKVGTCSALDASLAEGDVVVPKGALIDEGATYWRRVRQLHDLGMFNTPDQVREYIHNREPVLSDHRVWTALWSKCHPNQPSPAPVPCVWSVDAYSCFNSSVRLWSQVNGEDYTVGQFGSTNSLTIRILGVEMECSSLFASAGAAGIPAASLIVVSRTRKRLISDNVVDSELAAYGVSTQSVGVRNVQRIQQTELACLDIAAEVAKSW
jgi:uridine phosphorylase